LTRTTLARPRGLDSIVPMVSTRGMTQRGSCHCGKVRFEAEGDIAQVIECNCSHCSRKGYLLWFVDRTACRLLTPEDAVATYTFNKHVIQHLFCKTCGCAPLGFGQDRHGTPKAMINARCLEDVDVAALKRVPIDGRSF
jgi:hypothetical protein